MDHVLAQLNIARMRWPLDDSRMAGFVELLDPINELADRAPGFVWRLQTDEGDATAVRAFDDDLMLVNLSVWRDLESLRAFTYRSDHKLPLRGRRQWFEPMDEPHLVLWWLPAGHIPTLDDAKARLELLQAHGPTPEAFTMRHSFDPPR